ncbi:MAG: sodium:solute symporter family protein [Acidobacteriota bacterium]|nr:sodium:solute symporter family protein [Acidobacteriota bacterium]
MEWTPIVVVGLLLGMTMLGAWHARRVKTAEDFALAGRGLNAWILSGTLVATWIGTGSIFGNAEFTYEFGAIAFFLPISGALGMLLLAFVAPRVRALPAASVPQILGLKFGPHAQRLGALALLGAYMIIVSYQYRAGAAISERLFPGIDLGFGEQNAWPIAFAFFVILYTALAGLVSVAWTDVVNGVVMSAGILLGVGYLGLHWDPATQPMPDSMLSLAHPAGGIGWINVLLPSFLLILGDANLMQRFLAARSPATAKRAALATFAGLVVLETAIIAIAFFGRAMLPEPLANPGHVIVETAFTLLPAFIGILLASTVIAVIVSTADSFLLACSTTAATDLAGGMTTPKRQRGLVVVFGLVALALAYSSDRFFSMALYAYTLYGVTITPAMVCALMFPATKARAVVAGMGAGLGSALLWKIALTYEWIASGSSMASVDAVLPALLVNLAVLLVVNAATPHRDGPTQAPAR